MIAPMPRLRKVLRSFSYFRTGYVTYFSFLVGIVNVLSSTYFLAVENSAIIKSIFPTFEMYILVAILAGCPVVTAIGWFHFKKAGTFASEESIKIQNHTYTYSWTAGINLDVYGPAYLAILRAVHKKAGSEKLTDDEVENMTRLEERLRHLLKGGYVGNPPKGAFR